MGNLTNTELQTLVTKGLGNRADSATLTVQALNIAQVTIAQTFPFEELNQNPVDITLTASTSSQALSAIITALGTQDGVASHATVKDILALSVIDGSSQYPLIGLPVSKWEKEMPGHADADREARPTWYTRFNKDSILLFPTPDSAYTVRCLVSIWPTPILHSSGVITAGTDPGEADAYSELDNKDSAIVAYALHWVYSIQGDPKKAAHFYGVFSDLMGRSEKNRQPDVQPGAGSSGALSASDNYQSSAPSAGASAKTSAWDATYNSTPWW